MIATILLLASLATPLSVDQSAWLDRLERERHQIEFSINIGGRDIGVEEYSLGFPESAEEKQADFRRAHDADQVTAKILHESFIGLLQTGSKDLANETLGHCLALYSQEIAADPDDFDLRMGLACALRTLAGITGDSRTYEEAAKQFKAASKRNPESALPWTESAKLEWAHCRQALNAGEPVQKWKNAAIASAENAIKTNPEAPAGYFWRLLIKMDIPDEGQSSGSEDRLRAVNAAANEVLEDVHSDLSFQRLRFLARVLRAELTLATSLPIDPGSNKALELSAPPILREDIQFLIDHVDLFSPNKTIASEVTEFYLLASSLTAEINEMPSILRKVERLGFSEEHALCQALLYTRYYNRHVFQRQISADLENLERTDEGSRLLAEYYFDEGDLGRSRAFLSEIQAPDSACQLLVGIIHLKRGEVGKGLEQLELLASAPGASGESLHALGVARALSGNYKDALTALSAASEATPEGNESAMKTAHEIQATMESKFVLDWRLD